MLERRPSFFLERTLALPHGPLSGSPYKAYFSKKEISPMLGLAIAEHVTVQGPSSQNFSLSGHSPDLTVAQRLLQSLTEGTHFKYSAHSLSTSVLGMECMALHAPGKCSPQSASQPQVLAFFQPLCEPDEG